MKPLLLGFSGVSLALWSAMEASTMIVQTSIGSDTGVETMLVFQVGVLVAAFWMILRFGGVVRDATRAVQEALKLAAHVKSIDERVTLNKERAEEMAEIIARRGFRLGEIEAAAESTRAEVASLSADFDACTHAAASDRDECRQGRERTDRHLQTTSDRVLALEERVRAGTSGRSALARDIIDEAAG